MVKKRVAESSYTTISIPKSLAIELDKLIGIRGFTGRSEVIKQAVREYLDECYRRGII